MANHRQASHRVWRCPQTVVVSGSLGQQNLGDDELLRVFVKQHLHDYDGMTVLTSSAPPALPEALPVDRVMTLPHLAVGRRFWRGAHDRWYKRRVLVAANPTGEREYVLLGGLFAHIWQHNLARLKELLWAQTVCHRLRYYFGDVGDGFDRTDQAIKIVQILNQHHCWIAVRSAEAADILSTAGVKRDIFVGIDPVLFARTAAFGVPFRRRSLPDDGCIALNPCNYEPHSWRPAWIAAARAAIDVGLTIRWVCTCTPIDLAFCKELAGEIRQTFPHWPQEIRAGHGALQAFDSATCSIAARYHGAIFSITSGVPTIGFPYTAKVSRLFQFLGIGDWTVCSDQSQEPGLHSRLKEMILALAGGAWHLDYTSLTSAVQSHKKALASFAADH